MRGAYASLISSDGVRFLFCSPPHLRARVFCFDQRIHDLILMRHTFILVDFENIVYRET